MPGGKVPGVCWGSLRAVNGLKLRANVGTYSIHNGAYRLQTCSSSRQLTVVVIYSLNRPFAPKTGKRIVSLCNCFTAENFWL